MKAKNAALLLLTAALLLPAAVSCGSAEEGPKSENTGNAGTEAVTEEDTRTDREKVPDDLPEMDYKGQKFRIMQRTNSTYDFDAEGEDGDTVNDAIFRRNLAVTERYHFTLETAAFEAAWGSGKFNKQVADFVLAGDDAYELIAGYMCDITPTITQGLYLNWYDVPNVNLEKPWWAGYMIDTFTINDRIYMITGDLALSFWRNMFSMCFNKKIAAANDIDDLYKAVTDGKWTFSYMEEICKSLSSDMNGDGKMDENDMYGYISDWATGIDSFKEAFELPVVEKDKNGIPHFTVVTDRVTDVLERLAVFYQNKTGYFNQNADTITEMFRNEQALFCPRIFKMVETMRDLETDFGILPYPKWDEAQKNYGSVVCDNASVFLVPMTVKDPAYVGMITEAMAAESYRHVIPDYYDIVLKSKSSRDADSEVMIDLIRDTVHIDFGYIHSTALAGAGHLFVGQVRNGTSTIASAYEKIASQAEAKLQEIVDFYYRTEE